MEKLSGFRVEKKPTNSVLETDVFDSEICFQLIGCLTCVLNYQHQLCFTDLSVKEKQGRKQCKDAVG